MSYNDPILVEIYARIFLEEGVLNATRIIDAATSLKKIGINNNEFVSMLEGKQENAISTRLRCWDKKRVRLIQLSNDIIVFNYVNKYPGWDTFTKFIKDSLAQLECDVANNFKSIELRTIDSITVPVGDFNFSDWINCADNRIPDWYKDSHDMLDINIGKGSFANSGKNRQLLIAMRKKGDEFIIRIESVFHNLKSDNNLFTTLDIIHVESNNSFESLITDKVRKDIMKGVRK